MPKYQVMVIRWPERWKPECADDVPLELNGPVEVLVESDDLFTALGSGDRTQREPRGATPRPLGRRDRAGRHGPRLAGRPTLLTGDLQSDCHLVARRLGAQLSPGCAQLRLEVARAGRRRVVRVSAGRSHRVGAEPAVHGASGAYWHVVVAIENEPISRTVSHDPSGVETTVEVRQMHVIRPEQGGHGECSHCPAHAFQCAKADWSSQMQTMSARHSRAFGATAM